MFNSHVSSVGTDLVCDHVFRVGGLVQSMAWDQNDERLAVLCQGKLPYSLSDVAASVFI